MTPGFRGISARRLCPAASGAPLRALAAALALWVANAAAGTAQAPITIGRFDFNFSNPGARSLGVGGAFVALADDATAAFANPAGLVQLTRLELSVEGRYWDRSTRYLAGGRLDGEPTGIGRDTVRGLSYGRSASAETGLSFASVVVPRGRWAFAVYGHRAASYELEASSQRIFSADDDWEPGTIGIDGNRESVDLGLTTAGVVAAYRATERVSFGVALVGSSTSLATASEFYLPDDGWGASPYDENHFLPERLLSRSFVDIDDTALSASAGIHIQLTELLEAGLVIRQGARFEGTSGVETGPAIGLPAFAVETVAHFTVPDVWGVGLARRSRDGAWTFAGEVDRVGYQGLLEIDSNDEIEAFSPAHSDGWEFHLGGEYAFLDLRPAVVAVRLGGWLETSQSGTLTQNRTHWSAGVGIAARRVQVDLGIDLSEELDTGSISFVYSF